jgi:hypothetical protein
MDLIVDARGRFWEGNGLIVYVGITKWLALTVLIQTKCCGLETQQRAKKTPGWGRATV